MLNDHILLQEGIVESVPEIVCVNEINKKKNINIVYAGGLQTAFGIRNFIDSFVKNRDTRLRLTICGAGDEEEYIIKMTEVDGRISILRTVVAVGSFNDIS